MPSTRGAPISCCRATPPRRASARPSSRRWPAGRSSAKRMLEGGLRSSRHSWGRPVRRARLLLVALMLVGLSLALGLIASRERAAGAAGWPYFVAFVTVNALLLAWLWHQALPDAPGESADRAVRA